MKCYFCKRDIPKGEGYQWIHVSSTGKEYKRTCCSEEEKYQVERDKELYRLIQLITDEILGYPCINNTRNKKIKELQDAGFSNEQIYRCFKEYKSEIEYWINANGIDKEYNKIAYMFGVINNVIKDFSEEDEKNDIFNKQKIIEEEVDESKTDTFIEETDEDIENRLKNKKENKGILDLLKKMK